MSDKKDLLWAVCEEFVQNLQIGCQESVYQSDRVALNSLELIEKICGIVGYCKFEEDDI